MPAKLVHILLILLALTRPGCADTTEPRMFDIVLSSDDTISMTRFGNGGDRILWIPSEYGVNKQRYHELLDSLAALRYEVWLSNLHESYFIPAGRSSYTSIPVNDIAELIEKSLPEDNHKLFIVAAGRGAVLALRALSYWRDNDSSANTFAGIILISPNFQADTPQPGTAISYLPVVDSAQLPVFIIQPEKSGKFWYLDDLVGRLLQAGSHVYTRIIEDAGDGFYSRSDVNELEKLKASEFGMEISKAINVLKQTGVPQKQETSAQPAIWSVSPVPESLQTYPADSPAPELQLHDTEGKHYVLRDYRGKVVVINFWASWCPPCVEEIPSLGRLQKAFSREELVVLSVDIGESRKEIDTFLDKVPADFPVLLDADGTTVKQWKIIAFPTTFVIDRNGKIKLAYYGALQWDKQDVIDQLQQLVKHKHAAEP